MRLGLALGAAVIATTMVAYADSENNNRRFVFHRGEPVNADTNNDGWLSREEAGRDADRLFADLDRDNNGRLTDEDHELLGREIEAEVERAMEGVRIEMENLDFDVDLEGLDEEIERSMVLIDDHDCETTTETENGQTRTTTVCRSEDRDDRADRDDDRSERRVNRRVHVIRHGDGNVLVAPVPPVPPTPPMPAVPPVPHMPMFWMGGSDSDESDLNGDGWLSREEFRAQQLRHFDARDANNDGRVRYEQPPRPPEPPQPPEPPRRR